MHCLGAVAEGTPSPNGVGGRGGILSVFRALGVLVCEGRIQGPPRGYKEGPHCAPPMQAVPNDHVCEEDNYLCDRYLVLVREIADRVAIGSFLCVEVVLCSDCPCGLAKAASKNPICTVPSLSIPPWQHASEILLEYWCICVVPSKSPETMNFQGLYQAVRSRLHFSQVAAWWSKSNGSEPSYIATRVVPYNEDNLRKFRDSPVEHTFPLAGNGDGNSIKVTVWALPRMEEMPFLACPMHPKMEKDEEGVARALTPTKAIPVSSAQQNPEGLVLPALVDDRLQTPCNKPGKHHCRCEEEDVSPPSPSIPRPNGERKRRRSLPCGPAEIGCVTVQPMPLPSVQESAAQESKDSQSSSYPRSSSEISNNRGTIRPSQRQSYKSEENCVQSRNNLNSDNLERCFRTQLSIEEREGNVEKRYKRTVENSEPVQAKTANCSEKTCNLEKKDQPSVGKKPKEATENKGAEKNGLFENLIPFNSSLPWSFVESWNNSNANGKCAFQCLRATKPGHLNYPERTCKPAAFKDSSLVINPFRQSSPFHESNPGPSTYNQCYRSKQDTLNSACTVHQSCSKASNKSSVAQMVSPGQEALESDDGTNNHGKSGRDLSQLMSKLSFPEDREKSKEEGGFLDWFSKVPGRVLGVAPSIGYVENKVKPVNLKSQELHGNEVRFKNCNLELSQREFDEVLAVLRARTPSGRRRTGLKTAKRRDRSEKSVEDCADRTTLGKCGNLESSECSTNNIVNRAKSCDSCSHKLCRKNDQQQALDKSVGLSEIYGNKNIYDPSQRREKLGVNGPTGNLAGGSKCNNSEKRANDTAVECLQNVSNKADILLGAILRTSKDRKGSTEISNGTKPRSATATCNSGEESDGNSRVETLLDKQQPDQRTVPFEDEKSLPLAFNKRFNRFRQLFKKEQEKKATWTTEDNSQDVPPNFGQQRTYSIENSQQPGLHDPRSSRESRAKRRIDFTDFSGDSAEKPEPCTEPLELSTNGAHQNSRIYSTNYKKGQINEHGSDPETPEWQNRLHSTNEEEGGRNQVDVDDERTILKARKDCVTIIAKCNGTIQPRNCYSSSKIRNNNHKDSASVEDDETIDKGVPSAIEQERFRRSLENAASMVFHSRTGLPLTSSPAPLRRGSCCFDYDSSLNSVSSKRSALFELNTPPSPGAVSLEEADREAENAGEGEETPKRRSSSRGRPQSHALLGSFEESALNGRLEPVSTVHGFTAELGASGSFCPKHRKLPVTVFFYTLGDNDKVSTPYLAHINLGKKGYLVPRSGTIQVTLLNPLGTVVKMFVVLYDLSDMPPRSHTFLRQRTLRDKTLRYLVHLRFVSGKSGRIYLHTDIRMIICRKSDVDTASDFGSEPPKELRSYIHGPTNPKFSPRC